MSINSIEVRIHLNYKFNLRLSNFIVSSSTLYAIFKFLSPIYFELWYDVIRPRLLTGYSVQRYAACREVVSYGRRKRVFLGKKIALRVRRLHARGITLSSFQRCQWKTNIPQGDQPVMTFQDL